MNESNFSQENGWRGGIGLPELREYASTHPWQIERFEENDSNWGPHEPNIRILLSRRTRAKPNWAFAPDILAFIDCLQKRSNLGYLGKPRLYIDTCHWTHLADVDSGQGARLREQRQIYEKLHRRIVDLTARSMLLCPLSLCLMIETYAQGDDYLRTRKAKFMELISKNVAVLQSGSVQHWETSGHNSFGNEQVPPPLTTLGWQSMGKTVLEWLYSDNAKKMNLRWPTVMRLVWNTWSAPYSELTNIGATITVRKAVQEMKDAVDAVYAARRNGIDFNIPLEQRLMREIEKQAPNLHRLLANGTLKPEKVPAFMIHGLLFTGDQEPHGNQISRNDITDGVHLNEGVASCNIVWCDRTYLQKLERKGILGLIPKNRNVLACPNEVLDLLNLL